MFEDILHPYETSVHLREQGISHDSIRFILSTATSVSKEKSHNYHVEMQKKREKKKMKFANAFRYLLIVLIIFVIISFIVITCKYVASTIQEGYEEKMLTESVHNVWYVSYQTYDVSDNDTLSEIVDNIIHENPSILETYSAEEYYQIIKTNMDIENENLIYPGDRIVYPIYTLK